MRWLSASSSVAIAVLVAGTPTALVGASGSTVRTIVCSPSSTSMLTIQQPISDSIVNQPDILVKGTVGAATKVAINVNGAHQVDIPLANGQTAYSAPIHLVEGTHTVSVTAYDICGVNNTTVNAVITYSPNGTPTAGTPAPSVPVAMQADSSGVHPMLPNIVEPDGQINSYYTNPGGLEGDKSSSLPAVMIDAARPTKPVSIAPVLVAIPFVAGAGIFGWFVKFRKIR